MKLPPDMTRAEAWTWWRNRRTESELVALDVWLQTNELPEVPRCFDRVTRSGGQAGPPYVTYRLRNHWIIPLAADVYEQVVDGYWMKPPKQRTLTLTVLRAEFNLSEMRTYIRCETRPIALTLRDPVTLWQTRRMARMGHSAIWEWMKPGTGYRTHSNRRFRHRFRKFDPVCVRLGDELYGFQGLDLPAPA